jgi:pyridoxamine 5'-phosphate oxidase
MIGALAKAQPGQARMRARKELRMTTDLAAMRRDYAARGLTEEDLLGDPIAQFQSWFEDACRAEVFEPNAMTLATVGADGQPSARIVLLKGVDRRGLAFFTSFKSRKSRELGVNARAALVFWWGPLARQVRFEGTVGRVADAEADAYFASRPRGSQIGAWASAQSEVIADRRALEDAARAHEERFGVGTVPRPEFWGGFRLLPLRAEFWQGRNDRLHDRLRYTRDAGGGWQVQRLAP